MPTYLSEKDRPYDPNRPHKGFGGGPQLMRLLGIVPNRRGLGTGGRPQLAIPGTQKAFSPLDALQTITDVIEPQKGALAAAAKAGVGAKMAALLGIGVPRRYPRAPGQIDIPFKVSTPSGDVVETSAGLYAPEGSKLASMDILGDVTGMRATHGGRSEQSVTTQGLGAKGLRKLTEFIGDYLPDKEFMKGIRVGGVKGSRGAPMGAGAPAVGADLRAVRERKSLKDILMREEGTAKRPLTAREKEFNELVDAESFHSWETAAGRPEPEPSPEEVNQAAVDFLEEQFGIGKKKK